MVKTKKEKQLEIAKLPERSALGNSIKSWIDCKDELAVGQKNTELAKQKMVNEFKKTGKGDQKISVEGRIISYTHSEHDKIVLTKAAE